jgi:SAM-dependent methyltransferase
MLHAYYERAELWDPAIYTTGYERDRMVAAVNFVPSGVTSLLDVGCGNGAFLSFLEARRPEIAAAGIEPSRAAVGRKWCSSPIVMGDMSSLPFPDRSFDVVSSMAVLEHIPTIPMVRGLRELSRVARDYILIDLPYREHRTRIRCPECGCGFDPHLHLRTYSPRDISALFPAFSIDMQRVLYGSEAVIPYVVLRLLQRELSADRFPNAVCPQCGHRSLPRGGDNGSATRNSLLRRLWQRQPKITVEREVFALFKRS